MYANLERHVLTACDFIEDFSGELPETRWRLKSSGAPYTVFNSGRQGAVTPLVVTSIDGYVQRRLGLPGLLLFVFTAK